MCEDSMKSATAVLQMATSSTSDARSSASPVPHHRQHVDARVGVGEGPTSPTLRYDDGPESHRCRGRVIVVSTTRRVYEALMRRDPQSQQELPAAVLQAVPSNAVRLVGASALQRSGDQTVAASTVLPWLFHALGVPDALVGLLVPIRESGSMLPQAMLTPVVLRVTRRKWVFVAGALVQAAAVAAMALVAAVGHGFAAGVTILILLTVFSLGRSLCSISSKDVQGRTIPRGERGQINGVSTTVSGIVAITLGLGLRVYGGSDLAAGQLAWLLAGGAVLWVLAALVYSRVIEPAGEVGHDRPVDGADDRAGEVAATHGEGRSEAPSGWWATMVSLLRHDAPFRRFVIMRSLLLVSALSPPFIVAMAVSSGAGALGGLGGFIIASGLSALVGGPVFGRLADRSSRTLMAVGAGLASAVLIVFIIVTRLPVFDADTTWGAALFVATYFTLTFVHTGVRVGRKTYVIDMAVGDQRTRYVAVSNTAMGVILLVTGAISTLLSTWGVQWALLFLAALGILGVITAARLPEVSART